MASNAKSPDDTSTDLTAKIIILTSPDQKEGLRKLAKHRLLDLSSYVRQIFAEVLKAEGVEETTTK